MYIQKYVKQRSTKRPVQGEQGSLIYNSPIWKQLTHNTNWKMHRSWQMHTTYTCTHTLQRLSGRCIQPTKLDLKATTISQEHRWVERALFRTSRPGGRDTDGQRSGSCLRAGVAWEARWERVREPLPVGHVLCVRVGVTGWAPRGHALLSGCVSWHIRIPNEKTRCPSVSAKDFL